MNKYTYTNTQKDEMQGKVLAIAEALTNENWYIEGQYVVNESNTKTINVTEYMDDFTSFEELGEEHFSKYVKELIEEQ